VGTFSAATFWTNRSPSATAANFVMSAGQSSGFGAMPGVELVHRVCFIVRGLRPHLIHAGADFGIPSIRGCSRDDNQFSSPTRDAG